MLATVLGLVILWGSATGVAGYLGAVHEVDELFDAQLAESAETLLALAGGGNAHLLAGVSAAGHAYQQKLLFQVWQEQGGALRMLAHSANAPHNPLAGTAAQGFSEAQWDGRAWRFYILHADAAPPIRVLVGQDLDIREELAGRIAWQNIIPFGIGLAALALLLAAAIRRGLRPLALLAREVQQRAAHRLHPVSLESAPRELEPVVRALRDLFGKVEAALGNERRFTADAAHELRTPLAALRAQLQVAMKTRDAAERDAALDKCLQGTDRMTHLVAQLLTLARLEAKGEAARFETVDPAALAAAVCAELGPAAVAKRIALELEADPGPALPGLPELLRILLRNLVDNAVRYTPANGKVRVAVERRAGEVCIGVADSGPGVAPGRRGELGQRFRRLDESSAEGVGLGLSIARRIAEIHGAGLAFSSSPLGGLQATVSLRAG